MSRPLAEIQPSFAWDGASGGRSRDAYRRSRVLKGSMRVMTQLPSCLRSES
jgi:hypothetical protein